MKTAIQLLSALALAWAGLGPASSVSAGPVERSEATGAYLFFMETDATGCIWSYITITAAGEPERQAALFVERVDECQGKVLLLGSGYVPQPDFSMDSASFAYATLAMTVTVRDEYSDASTTIDDDLTWTATTPLMRTSQHLVSYSQGCRQNWRNRSYAREAEVTGSVSDGATDFLEGATSTANIFREQQANKFTCDLEAFSKGSPIFASHGGTINSKVSDAGVSFSGVDPSGCTETKLQLQVIDVTNRPFRNQPYSWVGIFLYQVNSCSGGFSMIASGSAELPSAAFKVTGDAAPLPHRFFFKRRLSQAAACPYLSI